MLSGRPHHCYSSDSPLRIVALRVDLPNRLPKACCVHPFTARGGEGDFAKASFVIASSACRAPSSASPRAGLFGGGSMSAAILVHACAVLHAGIHGLCSVDFEALRSCVYLYDTAAVQASSQCDVVLFSNIRCRLLRCPGTVPIVPKLVQRNKQTPRAERPNKVQAHDAFPSSSPLTIPTSPSSANPPPRPTPHSFVPHTKPQLPPLPQRMSTGQVIMTSQGPSSPRGIHLNLPDLDFSPLFFFCF
jgi:hypothetical protein